MPEHPQQQEPPELPAFGPWVWDAMDPEMRRERLRELGQWTAWLVRTFPRVTVPPCWWRHPDVREHLTALYTGWVRTYSGEPQRDLAEAEWISTLHSLAPHLEVKVCSTGRHEDAPVMPWESEGLEEGLTLSALGTLRGRHPAADGSARLLAGRFLAEGSQARRA